LYDFTFEIPGSDALSDHFGFVDFKIEGRSFVLNGEKVRLPGIGFFLTAAAKIYGVAGPELGIGPRLGAEAGLILSPDGIDWNVEVLLTLRPVGTTGNPETPQGRLS
jgi:hypothetical protein